MQILRVPDHVEVSHALEAYSLFPGSPAYLWLGCLLLSGARFSLRRLGFVLSDLKVVMMAVVDWMPSACLAYVEYFPC